MKEWDIRKFYIFKDGRFWYLVCPQVLNQEPKKFQEWKRAIMYVKCTIRDGRLPGYGVREDG